MVQLQKFLKNTNNFNGRNSPLPMLNSLFVEQFSMFSNMTNNQGYKTFMKWVRRSPQMLGFGNIIATDILSDSITFEQVDNNSGRNRVQKAEGFWTINNGLSETEQMLYDFLFLGIGYMWIGVITDEQLKEFCDTVINECQPGLETKEFNKKSAVMVKMIKDERNGEMAKKLRHVAGTTMTINSDNYGVKNYTQRVREWNKHFKKEEIITFKYMPLDGKIYPYPPLESILAEVYLLWLINQNYVSFFENGGRPDNVFILPKELAGSKNHNYLIETLKKYKKIQNKHGNLVFTGDLSIEKLTEVEHQMENKDLALYLTSVLAMFYGIPLSRIPFLVGKAASKGDSGGLAESGYWRKISVWQSKIEDNLNKQLWIPYFGVKMKFGRGYLQDEVRETQNDVQKNSVVEQRLSMGLWTMEAAGKYLNIDEEIIKQAQKEKETRDIKTGELLQKQQSNMNVMKEPDARDAAKKKQTTQLQNKANNGGKVINS